MTGTPADLRRIPPPRASNLVDGDGSPREPEAELPPAAAPADVRLACFHRLYEQFHLRVFRLALRMVGAQDAPDVAQQVFVCVFQKIETFRGSARFETWLYRIAVNECLQHLRKRTRERGCSLEYDLMDHGSPDPAKADERELLERALARLEPELRAVFLLREIEELAYHEIAESLDIPEGTVASRLSRARKQLKQILIELGWEP